MANNVNHFGIFASDVHRARRFYEQVFGWTFQAWGPPNFFLITTGTADDPGIHGALQERQGPVQARGRSGMTGYECTIAVSDLDSIATAVETNGGKILMPKVAIPTVGTMIQFEDTEGNVANAMQYTDEPGGHSAA